MCGIAGFAAARGKPVPERAQLEEAVAALTHRGPDGTGFHEGEGIAFGHTRLSIIDLERGAQPLANEDGTIVTIYNGEIWNHLELRRELERAGHVFRTRADTEVLVHGYEEWGDELPARLDGMFAYAIWDARRARLTAARDRLGKKPLYYAPSEEGLGFGSDARSVLLVSGRRPELDAEQVPEYLFQRYLGAPRTLFRGVEKLPPGHRLEYDGSRLETTAYWRLTPGEPQALEAGDLRELLRTAVAKRLMSDVPLGILLSGGVDSAAVLALMHEAGAGPVASFTVGFEDPLHDEREWAGAIAQRFGSDHHEIVVGREQFQDVLPRLSWYRDEPIAEPSEIPLLLLAELAGRQVKVVLTGDGGDEIFGGYPKYRAERLLRAGGPLAVALLRTGARALARRPSHRRLERAVDTLAIRDPLLRWASWFRSFAPSELGLLLSPRLRAAATPDRLTRPLRDALAQYGDVDPGRRMLVADFLTYLPDNMLLRADKVLMGASVEGRMPLVDAAIVERVASVPVSARAGIRTPKAVLREAISDLVPHEVLRRPKRGFPVPVASLLEEPTSLLGSLVLSERCLDRGIFDPTQLRALVAGAGVGAREGALKLYTVAALELFLRVNVDELRIRPPQTLAEVFQPDEIPPRSRAQSAIPT
jgi:asparagine synthase (glutamine-hydrolysing)